MQHFHIMRWQAISIPSGEQITVADTDYASFATENEARTISSGVAMQGDRCAVVACDGSSCTLHGVRSALPSQAFC